MLIHKESIGHLINWLKSCRVFSMAGYSDAEWNCILGYRIGDTTGLGQLLTKEHGELLLDVLRRRQGDKRFLFAVPECLWPGPRRFGLPGFAESQIDWFLGRENIKIEAFERDALTDDIARRAELYPFIRQLRRMRLGFVGPAQLRKLAPDVFKEFKHVPISTPNLHTEPGGIDAAVKEALLYKRDVDVWLVSAGVSAAVIIDRLHDKLPGCWLIDCGSIWDAFVGIGGQREWRAKLYENPVQMAEWLKKNLTGQ